MSASKLKSFSLIFIISFFATLGLALSVMYFFLYSPRIAKLTAGDLTAFTTSSQSAAPKDETKPPDAVATKSPQPDPTKSISSPSGGKSTGPSANPKKTSAATSNARRRRAADRSRNLQLPTDSKEKFQSESSSKSMAGGEKTTSVSGGVDDTGATGSSDEQQFSDPKQMDKQEETSTGTSNRPSKRSGRSGSQISGRRGEAADSTENE